MSMVELVSPTANNNSTTATPRKRKHDETVDPQDVFCPDDFINFMNDLVGQDCGTLDLTQILFDAQNQNGQGDNCLSTGDVAAAQLFDNAATASGTAAAGDPLSLASFAAPPSSVIFDHGDNGWLASDWLLLASEGLDHQQPPAEQPPSSSSEISISPPLVASSPTESSSLSTSLSSSHSPPPPLLPIDLSKLTITMAMEQYLSRPPCKLYPITEASASATLSGERTVWIMTGKVAQKSYGSEKRFLSPPPVTLLLGTPWWTQQQYGSGKDSNDDDGKDDGIFIHHKPISRIRMTPPSLSIRMSTNNEVVPGTLEWYDAATRAQASSSTAISDPGAVYGRCIAKHLHINDAAEKRKQVSVMIDIQLDNHRLGTFPSKHIKVISKPSKKKQSSAKHMDLYIHHGSTIALFNRIRSQTVSTKYLGVSYSNQENHSFVTRPGSWDPFVIWVVKQDAATATTTSSDPNQPPAASQHLPLRHPHNPYYPPPPESARPMGSNLQVIHYNQRVILQCIATGLTSPVMVIRRVDKGSRVLGGEGLPHDEALGDPVSQLHRIAFEIVPEHGEEKTVPSFLSCTADQVGTYEATSERKPVDGAGGASKAGASWSQDVSDTAMWTVIGTDCSIYSFWAPPSTPGTFVTPFPVITHMATSLPQQQQLLTLTGTNLSGLSVWFGNLKAIMDTQQSDTCISCRVPSMQDLLQSPACAFNQVEGRHSIPISLVRESDCIVYRTDKFYFF